MQYSFLSAAVLALVSSVVAQTNGFDAITSPTQDQNIPAGSSFDIIWQPGTVTGDITITLLQGATPSTLELGPVIAKSISNSLGKYTWAVPTTSSFATYGFEIVLDSTASSSSPTLQYSFPFHITGGSSSVSGSATGSASSTTTIHLSTGPSYTPIVTSTSSSVIPSTTSTVIKTSSSTNSTILSATLSPTSSSGASNLTLSTTLTKASSTKTSSSTGTSSASPVSKNAAATQVAGSIAMVGGLVLALAF